jgi:septum formation protein
VTAPELVLASASPRRRELLDQLRVTYRVAPADIDESLEPGESPDTYIRRMASEKARIVAARPTTLAAAVLAADTAVLVEEEVLGKPLDRRDGLRMLGRLSGRSHDVLTAVGLLYAGELKLEVVRTRVEFIELSPALCEAYLATDEPWDKAGAYGIQGLAGAFVHTIHGSYSNVVGLPLCETWQLLRDCGVATGLAAVEQ